MSVYRHEFLDEHEFITQCSLGGKDEDGDQAMGICFSPENHLEVYLFLNLHNTTVTDGHTNVNSRTFLTVMK